MRSGSRVIKIHVPLAEMFGYATTLRTLTQGRGVFAMEFSSTSGRRPASRTRSSPGSRARTPSGPTHRASL